jgi:anti-sigma regulatory factor (Ser/Thr protein kinase)
MSELAPIAVDRRLPCTTDAPRAARVAAADVLTEIGGGDGRSDDVALIVSELVSNAVLHGPDAEVGLSLLATPSMLRIEVHDEGTIAFELPDGKGAPHRGLALATKFSDRIGVMQFPSTVVWCEVDLV